MRPEELFSLLSDGTRLRSLLLIVSRGELCVCELASVLKSHQPKISRHLALMRKAGLVTDERRGQWVYYRLSGDLEGWAREMVEQLVKRLGSMEPYASDSALLERVCKEGPCG